MPKPKLNEIDKECPICGSIIWGKGQRVLLEGAKITVCYNCAQHGTKIHKTAITHHTQKIFQPRPRRSSKKSPLRTQRGDEMEIVSDFAKRIRSARSSRGLNQDQFAQKLNEKPSLLRRIEAGRVEPTIKLAKKIEQVYKIRLLKTVDETDFNVQDTKFMKKSTGTSLGDIAFVKKKNNKPD
ncbi:MAG: multiprotein bridging factor aMBF1 [Promethearchaeota archaeon]|jgi:putative transcription factor